MDAKINIEEDYKEIFLCYNSVREGEIQLGAKINTTKRIFFYFFILCYNSV